MAVEVKPEAASKAADHKPAEATRAEAVHSTNTDTDFVARVANANNPREMQSLLEEMRKPGAVAKPQQQPQDDNKPAAADKPADSATDDKTTNEGESTATEEPAATEATDDPAKAEDETPDEAATDEQEGDDDVASYLTPAGKRIHVRGLSEEDKVGRLALGLMKRNRDWTLEQAMTAAKKSLGIKDEAPVSAEEKKADAPETNGMPATVEATDAKIKELRAKRKTAMTDLKFDEVADLNDQIDDMNAHKFTLERKTERETSQRESQAAAKYDADFDASAKRASELYEFAADPKSEGAIRMREIDAALKDTNDPLYFSPNKPLVIAQMVGRELRIAPKLNGKKSTTQGKPVVASKEPATQKPKSVITEGGASTTPQTKGSQSKFDESVGKVTTLADLNRIRKELGLPH